MASHELSEMRQHVSIQISIHKSILKSCLRQPNLESARDPPYEEVYVRRANSWQS